MSKQDMGGPAFPADNERQYEGMTLWDYYAAAALQRLADPDMAAGLVAYKVGLFADAMLAQRAKRMEGK